tara:strand:- start:1505 stop:1723 length:219 start_codon:yes stop_codon:yes gene_type:complete
MKRHVLIQGPQSPENIKARQRLRDASRDLAEAIAEQQAEMRNLQGNLNSLDEALDRVSGSMMRAASMGCGDD